MIVNSVLTMLGIAAWTDWRYRKIGNWLVFPFITLGVVYQFYLGRGWISIGGMMMAFALTFLPVFLGGMGMGDQKLLIALGAWTNHTDIYTVFSYSLLSCLIMMLFMPSRWNRLIQNLHLLSVGWAGHKSVWLPGVSKSALTLPYAIHLMIAYIFLTFVEGTT